MGIRVLQLAHYFSAKPSELKRILAWIRKGLIEISCRGTLLQKLELAAEEAVVNIIRHAYQNRGGKLLIEIKAIPKQRVELWITDWGPPFNPLKDSLPADLTSPLEERKEGNLGIFLMSHCVDEVHYQRKADANVLQLVTTTHSSQKK